MAQVGIIGGNCVGLFTAQKLAENGISSFIVEEHPKIGLPFKCAGLVSNNVRKFVNINDLVVNEIKSAKLYFGDNAPVEFLGKANVVDRVKFDRTIYENAQSLGVKFATKTKFISFTKNDSIDVRTSSGSVNCDYLIGADGAGSLVGRQIGLVNKVLPALQARVNGKFDESAVELHFSSEWPDFFAWTVPESKTVARLGVATATNLDEKLALFLKKKKTGKVIDHQSGLIPIDFHEHFCSNRVALVGDSASHVKATTGGGIVTGLASAKILARSVRRMFDENDFTKEKAEESYEKPWMKEIGNELRKAYGVRKVLDVFHSGDYDSMYKLVTNNNFKNTLEDNVDMENYSKFLKKCAFTPSGAIFGIKMLLKNPLLIKEIVNLF